MVCLYHCYIESIKIWGYEPLLINIYWAMLNFMQHSEKKQSPICLNKSISIKLKMTKQ